MWFWNLWSSHHTSIPSMANSKVRMTTAPNHQRMDSGYTAGHVPFNACTCAVIIPSLMTA